VRLKAPLRIDFGGGFADNISFLRGVEGYLSNIAFGPCVEMEQGAFADSKYVSGSGLSISTAMNLLEYVHAHGGLEYLRRVDIERLSHEVWLYENQKYSISVGKGDVYPIVKGGFGCWRCQGDIFERLDLAIPRSTLEELERRLLLVYSGIPREDERTLEDCNTHYDSGRPEYLAAFRRLSECGRLFADALERGNLDECGELIEANWLAEKAFIPRVSNEYLDEVYGYARKNGAGGGKLSGAGGGGYFIFYARDREALAASLPARFEKCLIQPFHIVHEDFIALNCGPSAISKPRSARA
jgi:D-glycero-alpha-D-manno-heptose-7-phosphate kinase